MNNAKLREISERLRSFAALNFGSLRKMSLAVGRSDNYFGMIVRDARLAPFDLLQKLQPHGLDLLWLFTGQEFDPERSAGNMDVETERAYILQKRYYEASKPGQGGLEDAVAEGMPAAYTTKGGKMEKKPVSDLWDELSLQFPGTPLWEQLNESERRKALFTIAKTILTIQEGTDRTTTETEEDS